MIFIVSRKNLEESGLGLLEYFPIVISDTEENHVKTQLGWDRLDNNATEF
jgi:hypothetical protein